MAALPDSPMVSVEEYLRTSYDPDVEFVDGVLVERNMGDWLHSLIQGNLLFALRRKYPHLKVVPCIAVKDHRHPVSHSGRNGASGPAQDEIPSRCGLYCD